MFRKENLLFLLLLLLCSCTSLTEIKAGRMLPNQELRNFKDVGYVVSGLEKSIAIAGVVNSPCPDSMRIRIELLLDNLSDSPSDFLFHEITAVYDNKSIKVFSYPELVQEIYIYRNNQKMILRGRGMGGDDGSGIYQMKYDDVNYPPCNLSPETGKYFDGTGKNLDANIKTETGFIQTAMYSDDFDLKKLQTESIQSKVLKKGSPYSGILVVEHPMLHEGMSEKGELALSVRIGNEIHRFIFDLKRIEKK